MTTDAKHKPGNHSRGLSKEAIVATAIELMETTGPARFSLRKLGVQMECDPMAVLYHFKSKEGLYRAMADSLTARLHPVDETLPWHQRLCALALQYRSLALTYPNTFGLLQQFLNTGISDYQHIEMVYGALNDAGLPEQHMPQVCVGWYASVYGLLMAEIGGLVRRMTPEEQLEIAKQPLDRFPLLKRFEPCFLELDTDSVYTTMLDLLHEGIRSKASAFERRSDSTQNIEPKAEPMTTDSNPPQPIPSGVKLEEKQT